ncbi:MAG: ABC transporter substrate-binding protein [Vulcanimicrobiaceae bacterium]
MSHSHPAFQTGRKLSRAEAAYLILAACGSSAASAAVPGSLTKVNVRMGYYFASSQAYVRYFLGVAKGYYRDQGLDVNFQEGTGSGNTVQLIANGQAEIGASVTTGAVIRANAQGAHLKMVAATAPINSISVLSTAEKPIKSPKELPGKRIGIPPGTEQEQIWPAFLKVNSIEPSSIQVISIAGNALPAALGRGQIDAYVSYATDQPGLERAGIKPYAMLFADFGVTYEPSDGIVVNDAMISEHPDIVRKFVTATYRAFQYSLDHPGEAVAAGVAAHPEAFKPDVAMGELGINQQLLKKYLGQRGHKLFEMYEPEWQATVNLLVNYGGLKNALPADQYFTNEFVSKR